MRVGLAQRIDQERAACNPFTLLGQGFAEHRDGVGGQAFTDLRLATENTQKGSV